MMLESIITGMAMTALVAWVGLMIWAACMWLIGGPSPATIRNFIHYVWERMKAIVEAPPREEENRRTSVVR